MSTVKIACVGRVREYKPASIPLAGTLEFSRDGIGKCRLLTLDLARPSSDETTIQPINLIQDPYQLYGSVICDLFTKINISIL